MKELFVYKRPGLDVEASVTGRSIREDLGIDIKELLVINRYIINNISDDEFEKAMYKVFAEKNADMVSSDFGSILKEDDEYVITELLPGQFSMRNAAAEECLQFIFEDFGYEVKSQKIFLIRNGKKFLDPEDIRRIKSYLINPLEMREGVFTVSFDKNAKIIEMPEVYSGFSLWSDEELSDFHKKMSLAMSLEDLKTVREHFRKIDRDPSETEIRVLDTYWSDHCRHTTFNTVIENIDFEDELSPEKKIFEGYLGLRKRLGREEKPVTLMDIATIGARYLKTEGLVKDLDVSEEINACSIKRTLTSEKGSEDYLIMFKNETHNHPTEIEPFGGAATCLGGAIRDPLSGRSFVYQAMRVTGAADPSEPVEKTLEGKLPQKKITTIAAKGYSSYGNQIGLSAGHVHEIYHPGYKAKRMEVGAVIASTPEKYVVREVPQPGDLVILAGGRTGRDGVGGATGSSKSHDTSSIETSGAEVQKGNAPTERKIQRLMRKNEVKILIRRCNDFGAGGVSVAVGELADGLRIYLDRVPLKYEGLNATETAISESQERMAIVISADKLDEFMGYLSEENLSGTVIAEVTEKKNLVMEWYGNTVCDLERSFLDTAGAKQYQDIKVKADPEHKRCSEEVIDHESMRKLLLDLNNQSQRALNENFDSTNGCATSVLPFGGRYQDTESSYMAAAVPLERGIAEESTIMSYGYDPYLSSENQSKGANTAVVESLAKIAASGADIKNVRLSFQEYFEKLGNNAEKWGKPLKSLLGALKAQIDYSVPAIGGKDSMSGTFNDLNVPPTLISFAVNTIKTDSILTNLLRGNGMLYLLKTPYDEYGFVDCTSFIKNCNAVKRLNSEKLLSACDSVHRGTMMTALNMAFGERRGLDLDRDAFRGEGLNEKHPENFILAVDEKNVPVFEEKVREITDLDLSVIGSYNDNSVVRVGSYEERLEDLLKISNEVTGRVFSLNKKDGKKVENINYTDRGDMAYDGEPVNGKPRVLLLAIPGTNCEYDMERAFVNAGAEVRTFVLRNRDKEDLRWSIEEFAKEIRQCNILGFPGGFSAGDEPDGSGKFIANVLWNEKIKDAVHDLIRNRKGLVIGICNGFQALIRTGLVTYGEIREPEEDMPLLTANEAGKHMDYIARVRIASVKSPWLRYVNAGETYSVPVSHGEGRFMAKDDVMKYLIEKGMIMTQYCDTDGDATMEAPFNPNGSMMAVEGVISPCGRILGKMGHNERWEKGLMKNFTSDFDMQIFRAGVDYFRK